MEIRTPALLLTLTLVAGVVDAQTRPASPQHKAAVAEPPSATLDPASAKEFQQRLESYLRLRDGLARKLKPLSPTPNAADLKARETSLAAALKAARRGARPGDIILPPVARYITAVVTEDLSKRTAAERKGVFEELPRGIRPIVNRSYPQGASMPTVPPLLLSKLPKLPDNLQYRFFDHDIVLVDGDAHVIVDVIPDALSPSLR